MIPPRKSQVNRGPMPGQRRTRMFRFLRLKGARSKAKPPLQFLRLQLWPWLEARMSLKQLELRAGPAERLAAKGTVVVASHYGNHEIVDAFVDHHRGLGIREFVFLDLSDDGGLAAHPGSAGHAVWRPRSMADIEPLTLWLNGLRTRYAAGRWCLSLDTSDAFVFYRCESRRIGDFTEFLESESRDHVYALTVEMYGTEPAADLVAAAGGRPPFGALDHFDPFGFVTLDPGRFRNVIVRGGLQRRTLFRTRPRQSPALNRVPLVKWRWFYGYKAGTRLILPMHLNNPHARWHSSPTGCILRFALLNDRATLEAAGRWEQAVAVKDGGLAAYPGLSRLREIALMQDVSRRYTGTRDLVDCGLLNPGQWF